MEKVRNGCDLTSLLSTFGDIVGKTEWKINYQQLWKNINKK